MACEPETSSSAVRGGGDTLPRPTNDDDQRAFTALLGTLNARIRGVAETLSTPAFESDPHAQHALKRVQALQARYGRTLSLPFYPTGQIKQLLQQQIDNLVVLQADIKTPFRAADIKLGPISKRFAGRLTAPLSKVWALADEFDAAVRKPSNSRPHTREDMASSDQLKKLRTQYTLDNVISYYENQQKASPGSGDRFLASAEYGGWSSSPGATLFVPGIPRSGKSVMTSLVVNDLRKSLGPDARVAWFHFSSSWRQPDNPKCVETAGAVIATLAFLLHHEDTASPPDEVARHLEEKLESWPLATTVVDLSETLWSLGAPTRRIFLIFDAVDTSSEDVRTTLLPQLRCLQATLGLNILATGLLGAGTDQLFPRAVSLEMRASPDDIAKHLNHRIGLNQRLRRVLFDPKHDDFPQGIIKKMVEMCDGLFHFADLTLQSVTKLGSRRAIIAALEDGRVFDPFYQDLVFRLNADPESSKWQALLPWVTVSKRPLSVPELQHALSVAEGRFDLGDDASEVVEHIISRSKGLFILQNINDVPVLQFCHGTAAAFFKRTKPDAAREWRLSLARTCLQYISPLGSIQARPHPDYPFYNYASTYWDPHLDDVNYLGSLSVLQHEVLTASVAPSTSGITNASQDAALILIAPVHVVPYLGLAALIPSVLADNEEDPIPKVHALDERGRTPLLWAACGGSLSVVRLLLDRGADPNHVDEAGDNAVIIAFSRGYAEVALELLERGASIEPSVAESALIQAAGRGHCGVVQLLLDRGVNPGGVLENGDTATHRSAANGHLEVLELLIRTASSRGLGLDQLNHGCKTPLFAAACNGHPQAVRMLIVAGAEAKIADVGGQTALQGALLNEHWSVAQVLLASEVDLGGYDVEELLAEALKTHQWESIDLLLHRSDTGLSTGTLGRLLWQAARDGEESVVIGLLRSHPDAVDTSDEEFRITPLGWAAQGGHMGVIRALLRCGADVEWEDGEGKRPVRRAIDARQDEAAAYLVGVTGVEAGYTDSHSTTLLGLASQQGMTLTVRQLLGRSDLDHEAADSSGYNALSLAAKHGHVDTVRELLDSGRVSLKPPWRDRIRNIYPLFAAIEARQDAVVELLAQRGDVTRSNRHMHGQTALSFACKHRNLHAVNALLGAKHANPNAFDATSAKTPICWAVEMGHIPIIRLLLNANADVNLRTLEGWTPLHYAAKSGSEAIINLLLRENANANATAVDGTTPLVLALSFATDSQSVVQLLLRYDHISLHEQVQRSNVDLVRRLLDAGYNINKRGMWGRTALHSAVACAPDGIVAMTKALLEADPEPDLGIEDTDGLTPLRLALREDRFDFVKALLESAVCPTRNVTAEDWIRTYSSSHGPPPPIIKIQHSVDKGTKVWGLYVADFLSELVKGRVSPTLTSSLAQRQLFVFAKPLSELPGVSAHFFPSPRDLNLPPITFSKLPSGGVKCTVLLLVAAVAPLLTDPASRSAMLEHEVMMIEWIVMKQPDMSSRTGESWKSVSHFSTLPNGWIPDDGVDFFKQLLGELQAMWLRTCGQGEKVLTESRKAVLSKGGTDQYMIRRLLADASQWLELQTNLQAHVEAAHEFKSKYKGLDADEQALNELPAMIRDFADLIGRRLEGLNAKSQELIQIEFNLTSIAEAKNSTSTNNSMKRLTWITFIFLPLTFISTLFGMNVNVLDPPPPWWWYLPLALGTMLLCVGIWIIFKRNETLEDDLEHKFAWLIKPRKKVW
ncbi:ankyrin repeat-containing domain protein [Chaetomium fimeti]|uniref:Ankyrin repeat-containing domain protein n=1 Tax=Chaetomium fimeti TaxID=1854472 RepID=A0AAE0LRM8_9PEZI|nr:ankyrin repeat-containing domain protein [Chaetomium fimeti]